MSDARAPHPPRPTSRADTAAASASRPTSATPSTTRRPSTGSNHNTPNAKGSSLSSPPQKVTPLMQKAIQRIRDRQAAGVYSATLMEFAPSNTVMLKDLLSPSNRRSSQPDPLTPMEQRRANMAASSPTNRARSGSIASFNNGSPQSAALSPVGTPLFGTHPSSPSTIALGLAPKVSPFAGPKPPPFRGTDIVLLDEDEMKKHSGYSAEWVTRVAYQHALLRKHRGLQTLRRIHIPIQRVPAEERNGRKDVEAMEYHARIYLARLYDRRTHDMWYGRTIRDAVRKQDKEVIEKYSRSRLVDLPTPKQKDRPFYGPKSPLWKEHGRTDRRRSTATGALGNTSRKGAEGENRNQKDDFAEYVVSEGGKAIDSERSTPCAVSSNSAPRTSPPSTSPTPTQLGTSHRTVAALDASDLTQMHSRSMLSVGKKASSARLSNSPNKDADGPPLSYDASSANLPRRTSMLSAGGGSTTLAPNSSLSGLDADALRMRVGSTYLSRYSSDAYVHIEGSGKYQPSAFETSLTKRKD